MRDTAAVDRRLKPAWYFAATLPNRIPRCPDCGRPALVKANRVARLVLDGNESDPDRCSVSFHHRDCAAAPSEVPIRVTSEPRLSRLLELDGVPYLVTSVSFVAGTETVPAHWRVFGVPAGDSMSAIPAP